MLLLHSVVFGPGLFVSTRSLLDNRRQQSQQMQATRTTSAMAKDKMTSTSRTGSFKLLLAAAMVMAFFCDSTSRTVQALSLQSSVFHGRSLVTSSSSSSPSYSGSSSSTTTGITMRKQKASDRRTRKRQRGEIEDERMEAVGSLATTLTTSPMSAAGPWNHKQQSSTMQMQAPSLLQQQLQATGAGAAHSVYGNTGDYSSTPSTGTAAPARKRTPGRGRSRKRSTLYNSLAFYHNKFLILLTDEYQAEVRFQCHRYFEY